jgi:hypothetical protein
MTNAVVGGSNESIIETAWLAVGWVNWSAHGKPKWAGLIYIGYQGIRVGWWQPVDFWQ